MIEKKILVGGMNKDDAHSVVPAEDWLSATNIRVSPNKNGGAGKIKNVEGTVLVSGPLVGSYTTIGAVSDESTGNVFYFVTGDEDYILKYDGTDISIALDGSIVVGGLSFSNYIHSAVFVNGLIYWTDNDQEPRVFNPDRNYGSSIQQEDLKLLCRGPKFPLEVSKIESLSSILLDELVNNFTKDSSFQFAYRYIYNEYQYSVLSPFSKLITHNRDDETNDAVYISVPLLEQIPNGVSKVELLVRYGNSNSFYIIDTADSFGDHNAGESPIDFLYRNDIRGTAIPDEKAYKLFDNVPLKSESIEAARNRIFLANNLVGYNPVSVEVGASLEQDAIGSSIIEGEYIWVRQIGPSVDSGGVSDFYQDYLVVKVEDGESYDGYYIAQDYLAIAAFNAGTLGEAIEVGEIDKIADIGDSLGFIFENEVESTELISVSSVSIDSTYSGTQPIVTGIGGDVSAALATPHFKTNSWYRLGVVFYDNEGRSSGVSPLTATARTSDRDYSQESFDTKIKWEILSNASVVPSWASHYQLVRTKNQSTSFFVQNYSNNVRYVVRDSLETYALSDSYTEGQTVGIAFDLSKMYENGIGYTFQEGDLVRYYSSDNTIKETFQVIDTWGKYLITEYYDLGDLLEDGGSQAQKCLLEIYTPYQPTEDEFFYEVGEAYKITNGDFSVRSGYLSGDTYLTERSFDSATLIVESMNRNDKYWKLWHTDAGRASVVITDSGQRRLPTNIAYSNTFVSGSMVNGLNSFDLLDNRDIDDSNGPIRKLVLTTKTQEYGGVMLAICEQETSSIYLGETQIVDNADSAILATSGAVIGTINSLVGSYGTVNPESVVMNEGKVYWFDQVNGKVVRYAVNGLMPISDYGMSSYWMERSKARSSDYVAGYDDYHDEYVLRVSDSQVLVFSEKMSRWISFYDYAPQATSMLGLNFISFSGGQLYVHNSAEYSQFYGEDYDSSISFLANESFSYQRQYKVVSIEGNATPRLAEFKVNEPWGQESDTVSAEMDVKEGVIYIPILRDINSPNTEGSENVKRVKGDILQGKFLEASIYWSTRDEISIYAFGILCKESRGHGVTIKREI